MADSHFWQWLDFTQMFSVSKYFFLVHSIACFSCMLHLIVMLKSKLLPQS